MKKRCQTRLEPLRNSDEFTFDPAIVAALCDIPDDQYDGDAEEALMAIHRRALQAKGLQIPERPPRGSETPPVSPAA